MTWSQIFFSTNAKVPENQLDDFAIDYEEQSNTEEDEPLLFGHWDRVEYRLHDH